MLKIRACHPGRVLHSAFMRKLKLDAATLHFLTGLPTFCLSEILAGRRSIDSRTASALGEAFGTGPEFWLELQSEYETDAREHDIRNTGVSCLLFGIQSRNGGAQQ